MFFVIKNRKKKPRWTEPRIADAESLLSPPQLTTLQPLCCKMLAVPLWTNQAQRGRAREGMEGEQGERTRRTEGGVGKDVATATEQEQI